MLVTDEFQVSNLSLTMLDMDFGTIDLFVGDEYSYHLSKFKKGDELNSHYHTDWDETWIILEGEIRINTTNSSVRLKQNDIITIRKGQKHSYVVNSDVAYRLAIFRKDVRIIEDGY